jgi:hypothetical protein
MNEEIKTKILEQVGDVAELGKEGLIKVVEVLQSECPLLAEEILRWEAMKIGGWCFFWSIVTVVCLVCVTKYGCRSIKAERASELEKDENKDGLWVVPVYALVWMFGLSPIIGVLANLTWLKIWIAPRLFLLEYVSELIK